MTLLVTGVAGFIGSNFIYHYLKKYPERSLIGIDSLTYAGNLANLANLSPGERGRFTFEKVDITDREAVESVFSRNTVTGIINMAAETHVDRSIHDPQVFLRTNILGTQVLLDLARKYWFRNNTWDAGCRFLQVSTDEVYGTLRKTGYFTESTPLDPHSPYSASKAAADLLVKAYTDTYGLPVVITRCSNNYGPYQFPEKLIPLVILNAVNHKPLPVYGDGMQVRDWLHVSDHCQGIDLVFHGGSPGNVYNIGGSNEQFNLEIVRLIVRVLHEETDDAMINEGLITHVADRPGHDRRYAIDATKIQAQLGWKPAIPFEQGIRETIRWYLDHGEWLSGIASGEYMAYYEKQYGNRLR